MAHLAAVLMLALGAPVHATAYAADVAPAIAAASGDFLVLYPGVYTAKEKPLVARYLADNKALADRGPIDVQALVHGQLPQDTPGLGPVIQATEALVRYQNAKYDPDSPLRNDADYARRAGYQDILAYPSFAAHDDTFMVPYPPAARDTLLVSDLNHSITSYRPIYPGDTLYLVANERTVTDLTPPSGSIYRSIAIQTQGSIYNQKGEKVNDVIFRVTEGIKVYQGGKGPKNPTFTDVWEAPDWKSRPAHHYTDKDWETIRDIWSKERRRGAEALYWQDVTVGDQPAGTLDGPIEASVSPTPPHGMGMGGSRTIRKEFMDPKLFATMIRGEQDGIYRLPHREDYVPEPPVGAGAQPAPPSPTPAPSGSDSKAINTADIHRQTETRAALINYMGRDYAIRHITNWMGDQGLLQNIRWSIMDPRAHARYGKSVVTNPQADHYLDRVPFMRGRFVNAHGLTQDVAIVKSYVYDKYVRDGAFCVDLVWWIESIEGDIWEEGGATVKLPSRQ